MASSIPKLDKGYRLVQLRASTVRPVFVCTVMHRQILSSCLDHGWVIAAARSERTERAHSIDIPDLDKTLRRWTTGHLVFRGASG